MEMSKKTCGRRVRCALTGVRLLLLESMRVAASRASDGRIPRELMRLDASRAPDGRDSWKVTAVWALDLCLVGDFGLSRSEGGCRRSDDVCETRHYGAIAGASESVQPKGLRGRAKLVSMYASPCSAEGHRSGRQRDAGIDSELQHRDAAREKCIVKSAGTQHWAWRLCESNDS